MNLLVPINPFTQAAWTDLANEILANKFNNEDSSVRESLMIGLRNINEIHCKRAVRHLKAIEERLTSKVRRK